MTHGRLALLAGAVLVTATLAVAVSPFLHHSALAQRTPVIDQLSAASPAVSEITVVAALAAKRALACQRLNATSPRPLGEGPHRWCGRFTVTRSQSICATASRCQAELIGTFTTPDTTALIAVIVTEWRSGADGWRVVAVSS
jgi:hypothetical protein